MTKRDEIAYKTKPYKGSNEESGIGSDDPILAPGIGSRLREVADTLGPKANAAKLAGVSEDMLYRYFREESTPSFRAAALLCRAAGYSLHWLAFGTSPKRLSETAEQQSIGVQFTLVPQYEVLSSVEDGPLVERESEIGKVAFRREWIQQKGLSAKDLMAVRIGGDSMSPTIREGALVLVDARQEHVNEDGIYVLLVDGHLVAKRLQLDFSGGLYVRSDNPAYREQQLTEAQARSLYIIGRIVWAGSEI